MTKVIVVGHGGYGSAMRRNLAMLVGELEDFYFLDFNETDGLEDLQTGMNQVLAEAGDGEILFACDVSGGSPFRVAAALCVEHPGWAVAAGMNTSALSEISFNLELPAVELAEMALDVTRETVLMYPPKE